MAPIRPHLGASPQAVGLTLPSYDVPRQGGDHEESSHSRCPCPCLAGNSCLRLGRAAGSGESWSWEQPWALKLLSPALGTLQAEGCYRAQEH